MRRNHNIDKIFLWASCALLLIGFFILSSASMGLLARSGGTDFSSAIKSQLFLGFGVGVALFIFTLKTNYRFWAKHAFYFFIFGLIITSLVFFTPWGFSHGGAKRWLKIGPLFFQPSEILKLSFIVYLSAWIASKKQGVSEFKNGFLPFILISAVAGSLIVFEKDLGTLGVMIAAATISFFLGGGKLKHIALTFAVICAILAGLIYMEPYRAERLKVFIDPSYDSQGSGYQLRQSLLAIGSGKIFGKGFGMSIQKFNYLPEPINDSIFAVFGEEFGFMGAIGLISLFLFFLYRGLLISMHAPDRFGKLLGSGIIVLIVVQSFINIGAMVGILPLTGVPLVFVSKGGTALAIALMEVGILLNISKYSRI